jgi:hypothetical protein
MYQSALAGAGERIPGVIGGGVDDCGRVARHGGRGGTGGDGVCPRAGRETGRCWPPTVRSAPPRHHPDGRCLLPRPQSADARGTRGDRPVPRRVGGRSLERPR